MPNPQDPSLHRSRTIGALAPDSIEGEIEAYDRPKSKGNTGPVPPGNQSPYDPDSDQQPAPDADPQAPDADEEE